MPNFTDYFNSTFLGIIQGVTEFLPISSTAHINFANKILGNTQGLSIFFETFLHLGSLVALLFYYRKLILFLLGNFYKDKLAQEIIGKILLGFLPILIVGGVAGHFLKSIFTEDVIRYSLILGGIILIIINKTFHHTHPPQKTLETLSNLTFKQAFIIGLAQVIAIIPGVSRSGATIIAGMVTGLSAAQSFTISFIFALPTMVAANTYSLLKSITNLPSSTEINLALIGFISSTLFSFITFKWAKKFISYKKNVLSQLGIYRIILGIFI